MSAVELNARKAELVQAILNNVNTEVVVGELERVVRRLTGNAPCQYTPEELRASAIEAIEQRRQGRYVSQEQMRQAIL